MIHKLWGKAQEHPDYDKAEWVLLQSQLEGLEAVCRDLIRTDDDKPDVAWLAERARRALARLEER